MKQGWNILVSVIVAIASVLFVAGCDKPPSAPRTADGKPVKVVAVNPADEAEKEAVYQLKSATLAYKQALKVLHAYYVKIGAFDKQLWAERELANLEQAQTFRFEGVGNPTLPPAKSVENITEAAAVEDVLAARKRWKKCLDNLEELYSKKGLNFKLALVRNIKARFDPIRTYAYFLEVEIPPANLKPTEVIPAADALFAKALKLHKRGKILPGITDYSKERKALLLFLELVRKYPRSTKIAQSAYYIGEIYKEYFNENIRAVAWYQRAWQWDPNIQLPARSQAAFVYDFRLGQHGKALALYKEVIKYEQYDWNRVRYAKQRIRELTKSKG